MLGYILGSETLKAHVNMKRYTVLIIEADPPTSQTVADFLDTPIYDVILADDVLPAMEYVRNKGLPHIALIGLELPSTSGFELADRLKARADVPIIFMIPGDNKAVIIEQLKKYADDFVVKPFELRELETRMQMVLARMPTIDYGTEPVLRIDEYLRIDFAHNRLLVAGTTVALTPKESALLHILVRNAPRVVQTHTLLSRVWSGEDVFEDTLRVHMHRLRRKFEHDSRHPHYIRTERGVGYHFFNRPPDLSEDPD